MNDEDSTRYAADRVLDRFQTHTELDEDQYHQFHQYTVALLQELDEPPNP